MAGVGADLSTELGEPGVQHVQDDAGLDDDVLGADLDDPSEMAAEVDDKARPERLASQARTSPSGMQGDGPLGSIADQGRQILPIPRHDDAEGIDLVETGVVGVRRALQRFEQGIRRRGCPGDRR